MSCTGNFSFFLAYLLFIAATKRIRSQEMEKITSIRNFKCTEVQLPVCTNIGLYYYYYNYYYYYYCYYYYYYYYRLVPLQCWRRLYWPKRTVLTDLLLPLQLKSLLIPLHEQLVGVVLTVRLFAILWELLLERKESWRKRNHLCIHGNTNS